MSKPKRTFSHGDKEARYRKACERLETDQPRCFLCQESNPHALHVHHVAGQEHDDVELVVLCHNHHARVGDAQKDHPSKIDGCENPLEGLGHQVLGLAEMLFVFAADLGPHPQRGFMLYTSVKLQLIGGVLISTARNDPQNSLWNRT